MGTSKTQPAGWMYNNGNGSTAVGDVIATERGWELKNPDGENEVLQCMSGLLDAVVNAIVTGYSTPAGEYDVTAGDIVSFSFSFNEAVTVVGVPQITFNANSIPVVADYSFVESDDNTLVFEWTAVGLAGPIDTVVTSISLNSGTIQDSDLNNVELSFATVRGSAYVQPIATVIVS